MKLEFPRQIFEKYSNFIKIRPVEVELFHAGGRTDGRTDGQTDKTKLTDPFRNFVNAPKSLTSCANPSNEGSNPLVHVAW